MRRNPGPFEPFIYVLQTPIVFRVVGIGGLLVFTIAALSIASEHSAGAAIFGLGLMGALWFEASANMYAGDAASSGLGIASGRGCWRRNCFRESVSRWASRER